jgi:hypothetical protein
MAAITASPSRSAGIDQAPGLAGQEPPAVQRPLRLRARALGLYVYGKNLLDADLQPVHPHDIPVALLGEPRVIGLTLETRW